MSDISMDILKERIMVLNQEREMKATMVIDDKRTYTVSEIQDILGISRPTAYNIIASGVFSSVRVGRHIRVSKKSFDAWLDSQNESMPADRKIEEGCA